VITRLRVSNFKRFLDLSLPLRPLTVLTGMNGSGKSTLIQALLLARQAAHLQDAQVVALNGYLGLSLGEATDVQHAEADEKAEVVVRLEADDEPPAEYRFAAPREDRSLNLRVGEPRPAALDVLRGHGAAFTYLCAERLGPRDQLDVTAEDVADLGVGEQGQYTGQMLALHENEEVRPELRHPHTEGPEGHGVTTLRAQVEDWASDIIRPIRVIAQWPTGISASVIRYQDPDSLLDGIRPPNMGFGVSYALPIIVAGLLAPRGGLFVVENPEAHLHPAGQSRMGRFLGRLAGSGVQVIIETHSDHVLNGIRLAAVADGRVATSAVLFHFFDGTAPIQIEMTDSGGLTQWPDGFFDQLENDLGGLARAQRR
jgi:predicted ATPase